MGGLEIVSFRPRLSLRSRSAACFALGGVALLVAWWGLPRVVSGPRVPPPALALDVVVGDPAAHRGRRVVARGRYDLPRSVFVAERGFEGRVGARVYTPLQIAGGAGTIALLVDRGWIPENEVEDFGEHDTAGDERTLYGRVQPAHFGDPPAEAPETPARRWSRLRPASLQAELPYPLLPLILTREAGSGVELPLAAVGAGPATHPRWPSVVFALGIAAWALSLVFMLREARRGPEREARRVSEP